MAGLAVAGSYNNKNTTTTTIKATHAFENFKKALHSAPHLVVFGPRDVATAVEQGCIDRLLVTAVPPRRLADQVTSLGGEVILFTESAAPAQHEFLTLFTGTCASLRYPIADLEDISSSADPCPCSHSQNRDRDRDRTPARHPMYTMSQSEEDKDPTQVRVPHLSLPSTPAWVVPAGSCAAASGLDEDEEVGDELEAIDAIYPAEHSLTSKTETLRVGPRELLVLSRALDTGAAVVLRATVPVAYPDVPPELRLESAQGVVDAAGLVWTARELLLSDDVLGEPALFALTEIVDGLLAAENDDDVVSRTRSNL